jgi:hypothetical protein
MARLLFASPSTAVASILPAADESLLPPTDCDWRTFGFLLLGMVFAFFQRRTRQ